MKIHSIYILILTLSVFFSSCKNNSSPIESTDEQKYYTHYETNDGLVMKLDSLRTTYTLDEEVRAIFTVLNISDTNSIHIVSGSGPLAIFSMYDRDNFRINYQPRGRTATYYNFYFNPGDTLGANLKWSHITFSNDHYSDLKAYAGTYLITVDHVGLPTSKIGKWIKINEIGDPISSKLYYYFTDIDTLRLDFIVRNRISENVSFELDRDSPIEIEFSNYPSHEKIISISPDFGLEKIDFNSRSDRIIYSYIAAKSDSLFQDLKGSYYCKIKINFKSRSLSAGSWISL